MGLRFIIRVMLGVMTVLVLTNIVSALRAPSQKAGQAALGSAGRCGPRSASPSAPPPTLPAIRRPESRR